jgi:hypothetical protein
MDAPEVDFKRKAAGQGAAQAHKQRPEGFLKSSLFSK